MANILLRLLPCVLAFGVGAFACLCVYAVAAISARDETRPW